ncbi:MAG: AAA family ATPase [Candidatus Helarchaeota archaeon]|nr:AAA family ATPase [Candidatus Helarchaeota archaeon]
MAERNLTISISGKGGTGKTTFTALLLKFLIQNDFKNILAVDADPAVNLGDVLGIREIKNTIGEIVDKTMNEVEDKSEDYDAPALLEYKIWDSIIKNEKLNFDLLSMGKTSGDKCYCAVNKALVAILDYLKSFYNVILIDMEAGLEHLSRGTDKNIEILFIVVNPSRMSLNTATRISEILKECHLTFKDVYVIGNKFLTYSDDILENFCKKLNFKYLGSIPYDKDIEKLNFEGKSLLNLSENSNAFKKIEKIFNSYTILANR